MAKIFISYSHADEEFVGKLIKRINRFGDNNAWFDGKLIGGDKWWERILEAIEESDIFIYVLSDKSLSSEHCQDEYAYAVKMKIPVLPVKIHDLTEEISPDLEAIHFIDMSKGIEVNAIRELRNAIDYHFPQSSLPDDTITPDQFHIRWRWLIGGIILIATVIFLILVLFPRSSDAFTPSITSATTDHVVQPEASTMAVVERPTAILESSTPTHEPPLVQIVTSTEILVVEINTNTPEPTSTFTESPTDTSEPTSTFTPDPPTNTPEPTSTFTELPTFTSEPPTLTPSEVFIPPTVIPDTPIPPTDIPTFTPEPPIFTETPISPPSPTFSQIPSFMDTFDSGFIQGWLYDETNVELVSDMPGNYMLHFFGPLQKEMSLLGGTNWQNYTVEIRIMMVVDNGNALPDLFFHVRLNNGDGYSCFLGRSDGSRSDFSGIGILRDQIWRGAENRYQIDVRQGMRLGQWYTIRVIVDGNGVECILDDYRIAAFVDRFGLNRYGTIGFGVAPNAEVYIDSVSIEPY